jgi:hypothetical protein
MEAYAMARKGSGPLWSSFVTVLDQLLSSDGASELSPEDLSSILFSLSEMNLSLSAEAKNALMLASLERVNLFPSFDELVMFAVLQLESAEAAAALQPVLELMDPATVMESKRPSVVLLNLALRAILPRAEISGTLAHVLSVTDEDVRLFFQSAREIVHPDLMAALRMDLYGALGPIENSGDPLVDFYCPEKKVAVLVSSPLLVIKDGVNERPSGTAILRHRAVEAAMPGWRIVNVSAGDYSERGSAVFVDLLDSTATDSTIDVETEKHASDTSIDDETMFPSFNEMENDLSKFLRKDRNAAHRKRAPPSDSLPWVPSVLTLKSGRRRRNRTR